MTPAYGRNYGGSAAQTVQEIDRELASTRKDAWRLENGTKKRVFLLAAQMAPPRRAWRAVEHESA
jgi:hypothetical protein